MSARKLGAIVKYAVAEHAWTNQHPILWDETTVIDQTRRQTEFFLKEALHIHLTPEDQCFKSGHRDRSSWLLDPHSS